MIAGLSHATRKLGYTMKQQQFITLAEAADRLSVNPRTIRRRIADGTLTGYRVGPTLIRVSADQVEALLRPIPNAGSAA